MKSKPHIVYISVGSNLGNKLQNCQNGIEALIGRGHCRLIAQSRIYETEPVDYTDQDWFVNYVVKIETTLSPFSLLKQIELVQREAGRFKDSIRFGPRRLDLDIILYDDWVVNSAQLVIPHPRMHKRRFVLRPICDIDPYIIHPVLHQNMQTLLDRLDEKKQRLVEYQCSDS